MPHYYSSGLFSSHPHFRLYERSMLGAMLSSSEELVRLTSSVADYFAILLLCRARLFTGYPP